MPEEAARAPKRPRAPKLAPPSISVAPAEELASASEEPAAALSADPAFTPKRRKRREPDAAGGPALRVVPAPPAAPAPELAPIVEAILFAAEAPVPRSALRELLPERSNSELDAALQLLRGRYGPPWGVQLVEVASGFQLRTAPSHREYVASALRVKPQRLSRAALETLAVVAYRQPLTRPEIDEIRGVDSGGALKTLLERRFLRILGRKEEPGRPVLYGTSKEFLEFFGLRDLNSLPSLAELRALQEEEQAVATSTPEEVGEISFEGRAMGSIPAAIVEDLDRALAEVERASKNLTLPGTEPAPETK